MAANEFLTEDMVRDQAKTKLGFDKAENGIKQGTGQLTTFKQLGFSCKQNNHKPDGWFLPDDSGAVAIIVETKNSKEDISLKKWENELLANVSIAMTKYKNVVGILYNGYRIRVFKNGEEIKGLAKTLQSKEYYINLFTSTTIDKRHIFTLTKKINDTLHVNFGIKNLYHRMIFTACALVAERYGADLSGMKNRGYEQFRNAIRDTLNKSLIKDKQQNLKLDLLVEVYTEIKMNNPENQEAINSFIDWVCEISDCVNSDNWNGEDVMGIFFNEFNRYKKKTEAGQVFTPDHITSFMYRLIDVHASDIVLDATCGSGAFLVKAMSNMIKEVGGVGAKEARKIKEKHLYGIEFDREVFALACANMMIHKDGKTNLTQMDTRTKEACEWIKDKTSKAKSVKVLMNPPYERKYGCMKIVKNVLDSVPTGTQCAFILPDKKLEKDFIDKEFGNKVLENHKLTTIIKLPENLFFGIGITTSIYVFVAGYPQNDEEIFGCYIEDDGLETVKNQGRQDIKGRWPNIEEYWLNVVKKKVDPDHHTEQWINPKEHLSYQLPKKDFVVYKEDFVKTMMDYLMFEQQIDVKEFGESLLARAMYDSEVTETANKVSITMKKGF